MSTALVKLAENTGVSAEEISEVVKGMIISSKAQHGAVATDAEMTVVAGICAKYDLNPMMREAHAFVSGGKLQVIIGIDGWVKILNRQPDFDGFEQEDNFDDKGNLFSVTTKIYVKGRKYPVPHTEYMSECYQPNSKAWQKFKCRMLANKSLGQSVRIAFGVNDVIDKDEADRIKSTSSPAPQKEIPPVDFEQMNQDMAECGDLKSLEELCASIRTALQTGGSWDSAKAKCAAMKMTHKTRIEDMLNTVEAEFEEVEADVPFNGEEEPVEFEEVSIDMDAEEKGDNDANK